MVHGGQGGLRRVNRGQRGDQQESTGANMCPQWFYGGHKGSRMVNGDQRGSNGVKESQRSGRVKVGQLRVTFLVFVLQHC